MEVKYTKIIKIYEQNNCMCHNFYYLYYGRIYNKEHTKYKKFKYVEWFDMFDLQEYYEKGHITKDDIRNYALTLENGYLLGIKDYNDKKGLKDFYDFCKESIENYNKIFKY